MSSASTVTVPDLDLGEVENVADEIEQIGSGAVDGAREFDLFARQVLVRIVGELLAENENTVQRRAQLVAHIGQEFRLVLGGQRKFAGLFLHRAAGLLDFLVLALHFGVLFGQLHRLLAELFVGLLQFLLLGLQFAGQLLRLLEQAFGLHRGLDAVEHDADAGGQLFEEGDLKRGEGVDRGKLDHGLDLVFILDGQDDDVPGPDGETCRADRNDIVGDVGDQEPLPIDGALTDQTFAQPEHRRMGVAAAAGIGGQQLQHCRSLVLALHLVDDAHLGVDQRRQLGQQQAADGRQIALALKHVGELGEIGLQPVLFGVALGGEAQIADHRIDVVFQFGHFAARIDLNGARQVALGHGGRDFGDGAHLRRQIGGEKVHVAGQVLPGAGGARHVGLAAEAALDADFARHRRHLIGEGRQRVGHVVDGLGEGRDFALGFHGQVLLQIAVGDRRHDFHDAAHLFGQGWRPSRSPCR